MPTWLKWLWLTGLCIMFAGCGMFSIGMGGTSPQRAQVVSVQAQAAPAPVTKHSKRKAATPAAPITQPQPQARAAEPSGLAFLGAFVWLAGLIVFLNYFRRASQWHNQKFKAQAWAAGLADSGALAAAADRGGNGRTVP